MGPLVPQEIISAEWNFVIAFVIGICFGFVLESAGFSSSRKLAGIFYGYDTVVLKVFFTGAITAMLGLLFFSLFGWIDLNLVYVNPTYIWSAVIGGVIMGLGFITGGFCPGTSVCAAVIGKIDAMVFIIGIMIGIFIFGEGYPIWEHLYKAAPLGPIKIQDLIGISGGLFTLLIVLAALLMFRIGEWAEVRFSQDKY